MTVVMRCTILTQISKSLQLTQPTARKKERELLYERFLECSVMGKGGKTSNPLYQDFQKEGIIYLQCGMSSNKFCHRNNVKQYLTSVSEMLG